MESWFPSREGGKAGREDTLGEEIFLRWTDGFERGRGGGTTAASEYVFMIITIIIYLPSRKGLLSVVASAFVSDYSSARCVRHDASE